jgi:hypothetical protein
MAALVLITGTSIAVGRAMTAPNSNEDRSQDQPSRPAPLPAPSASSDPKAKEPLVPVVRLTVEIAGLGREGCDIEVKPGNASCKFRAVKVLKDGSASGRGDEGLQHVSSEGHAAMELRDVELRGADRTCTVAITVREPGQPAKTVYRGFRLAPHTAEAGRASSEKTVPNFTCYLSSPSKSRIAKVDESSTRK